MGLVHFQVPPWRCANTKIQKRHVTHCVERMAGRTASIEFWHRSWLDEAHRAGTIEFQRGLGAVRTIFGGPQGFANSVPLLAETTNPDYALVHLHRRNVGASNIGRGFSGRALRLKLTGPRPARDYGQGGPPRTQGQAHAHHPQRLQRRQRSAQRDHAHEDALGARPSR
ncbi:DUF72 domain-containing protein [Variovorax sp. MHTC-1]|uniref:DUF72 domain-containing protein n=1 Tax=Variovorax sp. MHTC-1 TaxID=2495593 RepID=UPI000F87AF52|nr:DUF72 domain-containing protein [Variovorax sp. MHTC-1]